MTGVSRLEIAVRAMCFWGTSTVFGVIGELSPKFEMIFSS